MKSYDIKWFELLIIVLYPGVPFLTACFYQNKAMA